MKKRLSRNANTIMSLIFSSNPETTSPLDFQV